MLRLKVIGKEVLVQLEELARKQDQVWDDSCDMGIHTTPYLKEKLHYLCEELRLIYKGKTRRWHTGCSWECFVPFEQNGASFQGVKVIVAHHLVRGHDFFSIDIHRSEQEENPFRD